jgi:hypothetical protein
VYTFFFFLEDKRVANNHLSLFPSRINIRSSNLLATEQRPV